MAIFRTTADDSMWRRHLAAELCTGAFAVSAASAGIVRAHYRATCWGKGPQSGLVGLAVAALIIVGLALLVGCWLASVLLRSAPRGRSIAVSATGMLAILASLVAAWISWPAYC